MTNAKQKLDKEIQLAEETKKEKEKFMLIIKEHLKEMKLSKEKERDRIKKKNDIKINLLDII